MNAIVEAAIAKAVKMPRNLPVGSHKVDIVVRIQGTLTKGEDYETTVYQSVPFDRLFAIALSKLNGVTAEMIVREALANEIETEEVKASVKEAVRELVDATVKTASGKTTAKLNTELIESAIFAA